MNPSDRGRVDRAEFAIGGVMALAFLATIRQRLASPLDSTIDSEF